MPNIYLINEQNKTCPFITEATTTYTFFSTNSATNATLGETKRHLSDRFGEHRRAIEKAIAKQHIDQPTVVSDHRTRFSRTHHPK